MITTNKLEKGSAIGGLLGAMYEQLGMGVRRLLWRSQFKTMGQVINFKSMAGHIID